jgi:hypothetical protein
MQTSKASKSHPRTATVADLHSIREINSLIPNFSFGSPFYSIFLSLLFTAARDFANSPIKMPPRHVTKTSSSPHFSEMTPAAAAASYKALRQPSLLKLFTPVLVKNGKWTRNNAHS